jgi:DNA polymerase-3 subunit epsilon
MRQIIIDTETTGLDPKQGHRIIELAALEVANRRATGRSVHLRFDPEREIDAGATEVHGMTWDDLRDKPKFAEVAAEFIAFVSGAEWIIHNAPFDLGFLDAELERASLPACADLHSSVVDTLALARELFPGKRNSLDALCERLASTMPIAVHGALLDAQPLADVSDDDARAGNAHDRHGATCARGRRRRPRVGESRSAPAGGAAAGRADRGRLAGIASTWPRSSGKRPGAAQWLRGDDTDAFVAAHSPWRPMCA